MPNTEKTGNKNFVKARIQGSSGAMQTEKPSREDLILEMERLRQEVEALTQEKADLEILLQVSTAHADFVTAQLHESNRQLRAEIEHRQRAEASLEQRQAELLSVVANLCREKADLEILLDMTTEHGDIIEELLHDQSTRDPLTGLFNRRYMEKALERALHRACNLSHPLAIVTLDIDHFQRFNNTYGHDAGDEVLKEVGWLLQTQTRNSDIPCRYGGEEFVLIFPETSLREAAAIAEKLRQAVKHLNLVHAQQSLGVITVSLGICSFPEHGQTSQELLKSADVALYRAKASGRDRSETADI